MASIMLRGARWTAIINLPHERGWPRRQKWVVLDATSERQARREANRLQAEADAGKYAATGQGTLGQYLDRWLADWARDRVAQQTYDSYCAHVRVLQRVLGTIRLDRLTTAHIMRSRTALLDAGLAASTVRNIMTRLRSALRQAVRWHIITRNPADDADLPRVPRRAQTVLTVEQAAALIAAPGQADDILCVLLAVGLGLRAGEVFALQWRDVDLAAGTVRICRSLQVNGSAKEPKDGETRTLGLPAFLAVALAAQQEEHMRRRAELPGWNPDGWVVPSDSGDAVYRSTGCIMRRLCVSAGLVQGDPPTPIRIRFHDLRHTLASILLSGGASVPAVSKLLGHANPSITLAVYSHVLPGDMERTAKHIEGLFGREK